nr:MAG TPA: hypothetical protein [Bacteriophage sp.]
MSNRGGIKYIYCMRNSGCICIFPLNSSRS